MASRTKARELAMQLMFLWDTNGEKDDALTDQVARDASDQWVERLAPQWPPRRQPPVDRSILRLGVWEMTNTETPPKVVIDEAIELAKQFSTEQSPAFVNAVLDAAHKERKTLTNT
jgi:N utilization substance protein B